MVPQTRQLQCSWGIGPAPHIEHVQPKFGSYGRSPRQASHCRFCALLISVQAGQDHSDDALLGLLSLSFWMFCCLEASISGLCLDDEPLLSLPFSFGGAFWVGLETAFLDGPAGGKLSCTTIPSESESSIVRSMTLSSTLSFAAFSASRSAAAPDAQA